MPVKNAQKCSQKGTGATGTWYFKYEKNLYRDNDLKRK
jgi:hypothetical protein